MKETISRSKYKEVQKEKIHSTKQYIEDSLGDWNGLIKVVVLTVLGWLLYQFRVIIFLSLSRIFTGLIEFLGSIGVLDQNIVHNILVNQNYILLDSESFSFLTNYGVVFSIIGFVDKFFPEFFPVVFKNIDKLRNIIPSFPFSGLIKFIILFAELVFKLVWIFSSSVIRFLTSLFSFIFVLLYKISIPIFKLFMAFLDNTNEKLGKASNKMDNTSRKLEK